MTDLPHPWDNYAYLQAALSHRPRIDARAWGYETGLNQILAADPVVNALSKTDIDRAVASAERLDRSRAQQRALYLYDEDWADPDAVSRVTQSKRALRLIRSKVIESDWNLLCEVAAGHEYTEIAVRQGASAGSLRTRVLRLRRSLLALAA